MRWSRARAAAMVAVLGACSSSEPEQADVELRCFTTPANAKLPSAALICSNATNAKLVEAALLLADSPRAGAWKFARKPVGEPFISSPSD